MNIYNLEDEIKNVTEHRRIVLGLHAIETGGKDSG